MTRHAATCNAYRDKERSTNHLIKMIDNKTRSRKVEKSEDSVVDGHNIRAIVCPKVRRIPNTNRYELC